MSVRSNRVTMPKQDPAVRRRNFDEVALGFTYKQATAEASRCLNCRNKPCVSGCPVSVDIPGFIALIKEGKVEDAFAKIRETNSLPFICGRVCPQENQCEARCVLGKSASHCHRCVGAVCCGLLQEKDGTFARKAVALALTNRAKVAVVGSGPAGLTAAADLALLGYEVTVFESLHEFGGVLRYGIPEFRLPKAILDYEIDYIRSLGVRFVPDAIVGKTITTDDLTALGYRAVFIGTGAGLPYFLGIPGENLIGVYSANEYLTRSNLMKAYSFLSMRPDP